MVRVTDDDQQCSFPDMRLQTEVLSKIPLHVTAQLQGRYGGARDVWPILSKGS